jgi:hypothetical protein
METCKHIETEPYTPSEIEREHDIFIDLDTVKIKANTTSRLRIHYHNFLIS